MGAPESRTSEIAAVLLEIERLADAVAEEELADMGLDDALRAELAALMRRVAASR